MSNNQSLMDLDAILTACEPYLNSIIPEIIEILVEEQIDYEQVNDYELIIKGKNKKKPNAKLLSKIPIWLHCYTSTIREKKRDFLERF